MMPKTTLVHVALYGDGILGDTSVEVSDDCLSCMYYGEHLCCKPFPDGIPAPLLTGKQDHRKPYPGDNGIQFERYEVMEDKEEK